MSDRIRQVTEYTEAQWVRRYEATPARIAACLVELPPMDGDDLFRAVGYVLSLGWTPVLLAAEIKRSGWNDVSDLGAVTLARLRKIAERPSPAALLHRASKAQEIHTAKGENADHEDGGRPTNRVTPEKRARILADLKAQLAQARPEPHPETDAMARLRALTPQVTENEREAA